MCLELGDLVLKVVDGLQQAPEAFVQPSDLLAVGHMTPGSLVILSFSQLDDAVLDDERIGFRHGVLSGFVRRSSLHDEKMRRSWVLALCSWVHGQP